ncbi:MAG: tetratricopeptide repeat protein [Gemmatimonadaceae bacterium]
MKASSRHLLTFVGAAAALASSAAPVLAQARQPATGPRLMVPVFAGPKPLGLQTADELRERLKTDYQVKTIWTVPKTDITGILDASGFRTDTAVSNADLRELARTARADEILIGTVTRTATGVHVEPRLVLSRDLSISQPLPAVDAGNVGSAVKSISKEVGNARKQLDAYGKCETSARAGNYAAAIQAANAGMSTYPTATLVRICRLNAYLAMKAPSDTIIANAKDILRFDPKNKIALNAAGQALSDKSDVLQKTDSAQAAALNDQAVQYWTTLISVDPSDTRMLETVIRKIVVSANPSIALPIIDAAVTDNPGNLQLLRLQWLIHLAAKDVKSAVTIGRTMVQMDTSLADTTYYTRQAAALTSANDTAGTVAILNEGLRKYPTNVGLLAFRAQLLKQTGRYAEAKQAYGQLLATNPNAEHAYLQLAQISDSLHQPDSARFFLVKAVQTKNDSASFVAQYALSVGNRMYKAANAMKNGEPSENEPKRAAMQQAITYLALSDSLVPSPTPKFLEGVSYFTIGQLAATDAPKLKSCELANLAQQSLGKAQIYLTQGGSTAPDAAAQYLGFLKQYAAPVEGQVKKFCGKGGSSRGGTKGGTAKG